jgi:hypothetical protein
MAFFVRPLKFNKYSRFLKFKYNCIMRKASIIFAILIFSSFVFGQTAPKTFIDAADAFFQNNVDAGTVMYQRIDKDPTELDALKELMADLDVESLVAQTRKAVLINCYNIGVIANVIDNYPIASPMEVAGFFDRLEHNIGGNTWTLDYLENKVLRPETKDARLHFVLVCGALGCPPIVNFAYRPDQLDAQLNVQTRASLNDNFFIKTDSRTSKVHVSEIFKWYEADFKQKHENVLAFINSYRDNQIPTEYALGHYNYDWRLNIFKVLPEVYPTQPTIAPVKPVEEDFNLQTFTPGSLLKKGQYDITVFNSIYTETHGNWMGNDFSGYRTSLAGTLFQFTYGVSKNARINFGFDVNLKYTGNSVDSSFSSIGKVFQFTNTDSSRTGISSVGPRIKWAPKGTKDFSIQSTFLIPTAPNAEGLYGADDPTDNRSWIDWDRFTWWNQFFYSRNLANGKMQLFLEGDLLFRFKRYREQVNQVSLPASVFISYFPTPKTTLYVMTQHTETFVSNQAQPYINDWPIGASNTASGVGFKYQIGSSVNVEILYTNFWRAVNGGFGETFNLGIKYIH